MARSGIMPINATRISRSSVKSGRDWSAPETYPITGTQSVNYYNEPIAWRLGANLQGICPTLSITRQRSKSIRISRTDESKSGSVDAADARVSERQRSDSHAGRRARVCAPVQSRWGQRGSRSLRGRTPAIAATSRWACRNTLSCCSKCRRLRRQFQSRRRLQFVSVPDGMSTANCVDYFYSPSLDETGIAQGMWGLFRSYDPTTPATGLQPLAKQSGRADARTSLMRLARQISGIAAASLQHHRGDGAKSSLRFCSAAPGELDLQHRGPSRA